MEARTMARVGSGGRTRLDLHLTVPMEVVALRAA
jgi:hypothetical protein